MAERFFLSEPVSEGNAIVSGDEAHHLSRVMRAKVGDHVVLFDGCGHEYKATIEEVSKKSVSLTIDSCQFVEDPNRPEIVVACALPKGDRQKFLVEKLVELGANRLVPLKTSRSVAEASEKALERIRKQVIEASKQCRRNWLMEVSREFSVEGLINEFGSFEGGRMVADPYAESADLLVDDEPAVIAVGPEGGFAPDEIQCFQNGGWAKICFSPNVLRVETAAAAAVAIARESKSRKSRA